MNSKSWIMALIALAVVAVIVTVSVVLTRDDDNNTSSNERTIQVDNPPVSSSGPNTKNITIDFSDAPTTGATTLSLVKSDTDTLVTLVHLTSDGNSFRPIGRSYDGKGWETAAGYYANKVTFNCIDAENSCKVTLPVPEQDDKAQEATEMVQEEVYQLTTFPRPDYRERDVLARFLEQTTFGITTQDLDSFDSATTLDMAKWILKQQTETPYVSHRALFRRYLNSQFPVPSPVGPITVPCQASSRYRLSTFSVKDTEKIVTIRTLPSGNKALLVDGHVRTVVGTEVYVFNDEGLELATDAWPDGDYSVCFVIEVFDEGNPVSVLLLDHDSFGDCVPVLFQPDPFEFESNPRIRLDEILDSQIVDADLPMPLVVNLADQDAELIDLVYNQGYEPVEQDIILQRSVSSLDNCPDAEWDPNDEIPVFVRWENRLYIHDPRFVLLDNDLDDPLADGGGEVVDKFADPFQRELTTMCANVPRTFLNEDHCHLSELPTACPYTSRQEQREDEDSANGLEAPFLVSHESMRAIYEVTGAGAPGTVYVYAIGNLDITRDPEAVPPCQAGSISRWIPGPCTQEGPLISSQTNLLMGNIIARFNEENQNPLLLDIFHPRGLDLTCSDEDTGIVGFEVKDIDDGALCWRNVHADLYKVYDFTPWTVSHPGNSELRNPITEVAEAGNSTLLFPSWHELNRWNDNKGQFEGGEVSLGDTMNFYDLPEELVTEELANELGITLAIVDGGQQGEAPGATTEATMVCGSPFEISNDPRLGGKQGKGAFDASTVQFQTTFEPLNQQRRMIWTKAVLEDSAQLRQRVAWALSQILVISPAGITEGQFLTEAFVTYYDIFVRNAFGNYRDVLKEVSHSIMMADMLTFLGMKSTAATWEEEEVLSFADENFAREVLQLFTTGLFRLNKNGTEIEGAESVYSNDDIEEYARAWTGFVMQAPRGNIEAPYLNRVDPTRIIDAWRDRFPKMGLERKYVGDGYPLCADLPPKHFLARGAKYRLLGSSPSPEMQRDPPAWLDADSNAVYLSLDSDSALFDILCNPSLSSGSCDYLPQITLEDSIACFGVECEVDTIRTVHVNGQFYEYIRRPCVQQSFYENAKTMVRKLDGIQMCGDPRVETATTACCGGADQSWAEKFWGELTKYDSSAERCSEGLCNGETSPSCDEQSVGSQCYNFGFYWTSEPCQLQIKINDQGKVAVVHKSWTENDADVASLVQERTQTFFRVDWQADFDLSTCAQLSACKLTDDEACLCDVSVTEEQVFAGPDTPSIGEIDLQLHVGAPNDDENTWVDDGVQALNIGGDGLFSMSTFFVYTDSFGVRQRRKNLRSTVFIEGTNLGFRNPPHFMSLSAPETRDAHHETDAVLDHYLYHPNTAPFLAIRFAQRFGISNPSPGFIHRVVDAFTEGTYTYRNHDGVEEVTFGDGRYGSLAAAIAALLLDDETRNVILDSDPIHGSFKEPLLKITGLFRSLGFEMVQEFPWVEFSDAFNDQIGQNPHNAPSVFSFFLPEYQPAGRIAQGTLVAPESQVLTGPRIVDTFNGIFSLMKYGYTFCFGGFAPRDRFERFPDNRCNQLSIGNSDASLGRLAYSAENDSPEVLIDELATLMTAGRLSAASRNILENVYQDEQSEVGMIKAQMLMAASPEFHVTNLVRQSEQQREEEPLAPPSSSPYKAVINIQLQGGVDSYNILAPHRCTAQNSNGQTLLEQYTSERSTIAFTEDERTRIIDAVDQPCDQFAIHPNLPVLERLYKNGELAFMANIGQLDTPVTKEDYIFETRTELFAHNTMQHIAQRIDPWDEATGTGILGRMSDMLSASGFNAQPITISEATVATVGAPGGGTTPLTVSARGINQFAPRPPAEMFDIEEFLPKLNNATGIHSSIYGETWSDRLQKGVSDATKLSEAISNVQLTQSYQTGGGSYVQKIQTLMSLLLTHKERGTDRDLFWLNLGSWDHHENLKPELASECQLLNGALTLLEQELKAQGYYNNVTIVITSDFARTLTANSGTGSDHAWGGNLFTFGGSVKGNQIFGEYPSDITFRSPLNVGRGRLIPTLSWESMFNGVAEWMGIETEEGLDYCLPNRHQTRTTLFSKTDMFHEA